MRYVLNIWLNSLETKQTNVPQFELIDPKRYKVENAWFFRQYGMDVRLHRRAVENRST